MPSLCSRAPTARVTAGGESAKRRAAALKLCSSPTATNTVRVEKRSTDYSYCWNNDLSNLAIVSIPSRPQPLVHERIKPTPPAPFPDLWPLASRRADVVTARPARGIGQRRSAQRRAQTTGLPEQEQLRPSPGSGGRRADS